jgi:hypothetical protein
VGYYLRDEVCEICGNGFDDGEEPMNSQGHICHYECFKEAMVKFLDKFLEEAPK